MIAVLGASGQLGSTFVAVLGPSCVPVTRRELDLRILSDVQPWIKTNRPRVILNCAAYTDVDLAETDVEDARVINALAVGEIARGCKVTGARLIHFSTDYVFDGGKRDGYLEDDVPNPLNVYGKTKLEGELAALYWNENTVVVRTSWLMSGRGDDFVTRILRQLSNGRSVAVVDDQFAYPTFAGDLVRSCMEMFDVEGTGVLHLTNRGMTSWYELAVDIAHLAGFSTEFVEPISTASLGRPATRPRYSMLNSGMREAWGIAPLPCYMDTLAQLIGKQC